MSKHIIILYTSKIYNLILGRYILLEQDLKPLTERNSPMNTLNRLTNIDPMRTLKLKIGFAKTVTVVALATFTISSAIAAGGKDSGGQSGARLSNGAVVPLDYLIATSNKPMDVKNDPKYKKAYAYFVRKTEAIRKVIPSLAEDLVKNFDQLNWISTKMEVNSTNCMNNLGVLKLQKGQSEIGIACQDQRGRVLVSQTSLNAFPAEQLLGVVFLHESAVRTMLKVHSESEAEYIKAEVRLTQEFVPYLLQNESLQAQALYDHVHAMGFTKLNQLPGGADNQYLIEFNQEAHQNYLNYLAWKAEQDAYVKTVIDKIRNGKAQSESLSQEKFWPMSEEFMQCDLGLRQFATEESMVAYLTNYTTILTQISDAIVNYEVGIELGSKDFRLPSNVSLNLAIEYMSLITAKRGQEYSPQTARLMSLFAEVVKPSGYANKCLEKIKAANPKTATQAQ